MATRLGVQLRKRALTASVEGLGVIWFRIKGLGLWGLGLRV